MSDTPAPGKVHPREKVKEFPATPGVYLMKDAQERVVYIGKAKSLRSRVGSYFQEGADLDPRIAPWIGLVVDVDYLCCDSEVDALLTEARLIKDIQPRFNRDLKDDKSFPYLQITVGEDYPRVTFTRMPQEKGVKLYGPFTSPRKLRGAIQVLQKIFKFRTCTLDIVEGDARWRWYRPCLLHSINQCTAPCNLRIDREAYRKDIRRLMLFLDGKKDALIGELEGEMKAASQALQFEKAAALRDSLNALKGLAERGDLRLHEQPEVFPIDPKKGLEGLKRIFHLESTPRRIEGVDIAHLGGTEMVGSLVTFIDGLPFKPGYRRYKIKSVKGIDDFASIREVVSRRIRGLRERDEPMPDVMLIDGGKGQLKFAVDAFKAMDQEPPMLLLSIAKREEELFIPGRPEPIKLKRRSYALRLLQSVRDEAHRFAQHYHHLLRHRRLLGDEES